MSIIQRIRTANKVLDDLSRVIQDPSSAGPIGAQVGNAGQTFCRSWSAVDPWVEAATGVAPGLGPFAGLGTISEVCRPYLDDLGFDGPTISPPPFTGGQCVGEPYQVTYTYTTGPCDNPTANINGPFTFNTTGPVTRNRTETPISGTVKTVRLFINGTQVQQFNLGLNCAVNPFALTGGEWGQFTPTRTNGPDNCGDLPGDLEPGLNPAPSPGPFPPGEEPGIDPTGQPFFFVPPIETPFGDIEVPEDYFDSPPAPPAPPSGDGLPGDGAAIGDEAGEVTGGEDGENIDFGQPPEGRTWVGCIVELSADSRLGNIPGTGPSNTVWPLTLGNAALNYDDFSGSNVRLQARYTELFRPITSLIVTGCFLQTQPGATAKVFPLSAPTCPENPCEA